MFQSYEIKSDKSYGTKHVPILRERLNALGLDGFIVPHADEYQNEYLPDCGERLKWISGFTGSAGAAVILMDRAAIFVDGRYTIQVRAQVDDALFEFEDLVTAPPSDWIEKNVPSGARLGYDPWLHGIEAVNQFKAAAKRAGVELVSLPANPIDESWDDRPDKPLAKINPHGTQYAGQSSEEKRLAIGEALGKRGGDAIVLAQPASIAWLLNIRGGDVSHSPLPLSRVVLNSDGTAGLFVDERKVTPALKAHLGNSITIRDEDNLAAALAELGKAGKTVEADAGTAPAWVFERLTEAGATVKRFADPCVLPRAKKNMVEREGARQAHIRDGVAVSKFLCWLETAGPTGEHDEISVAKQLEAFRCEDALLRDISFTTISAVGPNAAFPHYSVDTNSNRKLEMNGIYLVDSGGQYPDGTTDITRTVVIGAPTDEMKDRFTRVLKGHIGISSCRFPEGTAGGQLDILARHALWQAGLNFNHGTGHGVGSYLGVHEGPHSIAAHKKAMDAPLAEGMIVSNEPGYYREGHYGIRIENLILVTAPEAIDGGELPMHGFENLTLAPIDLNLVEKSIMSDSEIAWLNDYHGEVRKVIGPLVEGETKAWLEKATRAI